MSENFKVPEGKTVLMLCEGVDEKIFFMWFLDFYKKQGMKQYEKIFLIDIGGINDLATQLQLWMLSPGFENIKAIGIIRDAEINAEGAEKSIQKILHDNYLLVPDNCFTLKSEENKIAIEYALLPGIEKEKGKYENGTLENLCIKVIDDSQINDKIRMIDEFLKSVESNFNTTFPRIHKNKMHLYFSIHDKYVGLKIGEAAKVGAFDFTKQEMQQFKKMFDDLSSF